jgi:hypothetical protein
MALYANYLKDGKVKESFLGNDALKDTPGEAYLSAAEDELNSLGLSWKDNQGLLRQDTDGAPNVTGNITGLATKMRNVAKHLYNSCALYSTQVTTVCD